MNTHTHTPKHTPTLAHALAMHTLADTAANGGLRTMRRTLAGDEACAALGLAPRTPPAAKPAPRVSARKPAPAAPRSGDDADEQAHTWRVCVLVRLPESEQALTHVWVSVNAPGAQRAGKQARADARRAGHEPAGVCAVIREDAPSAVLAAAV